MDTVESTSLSSTAGLRRIGQVGRALAVALAAIAAVPARVRGPDASRMQHEPADQRL